MLKKSGNSGVVIVFITIKFVDSMQKRASRKLSNKGMQNDNITTDEKNAVLGLRSRIDYEFQ